VSRLVVVVDGGGGVVMRWDDDVIDGCCLWILFWVFLMHINERYVEDDEE